MLFPSSLAILLLTTLPTRIAAHLFELADNNSNSYHGDAPYLSHSYAIDKRQTDQKLWIGYQATFLWSAAIISTASPTAPVHDMNQFYADVSTKAESEILAYSARNPGKQPQGTWEFYKRNLHFTAIAPNDGTISLQLMSYALSRLGPLTARGWTQHCTAIFRESQTKNSFLVNVEATNSPDGVVAVTLFHGYSPPELTPSSARSHSQIPNSHNDAGGKADLSE